MPHRRRKQPDNSTPPARRTMRLVIRVRPDELAEIANRAGACGTPIARYAREVALGVTPRARRTQANADLIRQLNQIGNNLNQLARVANSCGQLGDEGRLRAVLDEVVTVIARIE
jgi:hypothetical protein